MMTLDEARSHVGRTVVYQSGTEEAEEFVITDVATYYVFARRRGSYYYKAIRPEDLTLLDEPEPQEPGDLMAASQASLNEIVAAMIRGAPGDRDRAMPCGALPEPREGPQGYWGS